MKQRNTTLIVNGHERKRRARNHMPIAQPARDALGKVSFAHSRATGQDEHIAVLKARCN